MAKKRQTQRQDGSVSEPTPTALQTILYKGRTLEFDRVLPPGDEWVIVSVNGAPVVSVQMPRGLSDQGRAELARKVLSGTPILRALYG